MSILDTLVKGGREEGAHLRKAGGVALEMWQVGHAGT